MLDAFLKNLNDHRLFQHNQKLILAVSGGIDSMVMVDLFIKTGTDVAFAHCNFGLRGRESDADENFLKEIAARFNLPIYVNNLDAKAHASEQKLSIQMAARDLRYHWFDELIRSTEYELYATAHHFDDQLETFFINILRGTGINGLTGIPIKNGNCIRPLLFADRNMIVDYAKKNRIDFREDSSNNSDNYLRNRIRHWVLPSLDKTKMNYKSGFENTFAALQSTGQFVSSQVDEIKNDLLRKENHYIKIDIRKLLQIKEPAFVLFELVKDLNFNFPTIREVISGLNKNPGKRFFSATHELIIDRHKLLIGEIKKNDSIELAIAEDISAINFPINMKFYKFEYKGQKIPPELNVAWIDHAKLEFPLQIRKYQEGDFFYPLGMKGRKKLSDFFIDEKFSIPQKRKTYVLVSQGKIVWIIGHRIDNRFKITSKTSQVYAMEVILKAL